MPSPTVVRSDVNSPLAGEPIEVTE
jgi:hypothetical protein